MKITSHRRGGGFTRHFSGRLGRNIFFSYGCLVMWSEDRETAWRVHLTRAETKRLLDLGEAFRKAGEPRIFLEKTPRQQRRT